MYRDRIRDFTSTSTYQECPIPNVEITSVDCITCLLFLFDFPNWIGNTKWSLRKSLVP